MYQIFPTRQDEYRREIREYLTPHIYRIVATDLSIQAARAEMARLTRLTTVRTFLAPVAQAA